MQKRLQDLLDENRKLRRSIDFVAADDPVTEPGPPEREPVKGSARRKRREPPRA